MYDVAIYDSVGLAISHRLYDIQGLGGSEFQQLLLAESIAQNGYNVLYLSKKSTVFLQKYDEGSIRYAPLDHEFETKNLIIVRNSQYNWKKQNYENLFVYAHDTNYGSLYRDAHNEMFKNTNAKLLCVSAWQEKLFQPLNWATTVVHNSIPDWVFDFDISQKKKQFIYASAAWKGLPNTLSVFNQIKNTPDFKDYKLKVLSPGYENFDGNHLTNSDIEWVGSVKFNEVIKHIAESQALLYYNTMAETFGIVPVLAAVLKTTPLIYQADRTWYSGGALPEIIGSRFVTDNFGDFIKLIYNYQNVTGQLRTIDYRHLSQTQIFENFWKPVLDLK